MTSESYFQELTRLLAPLTADERSEAVAYFQDYAEDGGLLDGDAITTALGSPRQLALQILADYSIKSSTAPAAQGTPPSPRSNARQIWLIILAILSAPMTVPVGIALFAIMLALIIVVASVVFSILIILAAVVVTGIGAGLFSLYSGAVLIGGHLMVGLTYLGLGLAGMGLGLLFIPVVKWTTQGIFSQTARFFRWIYRRIGKKPMEGQKQ